MTYLVDANVLSEPTMKSPAAEVVHWLREHELELVVTPIILGELELGILKMLAGRHRSHLTKWFSDVVSRLPTLDITRNTARVWASMLADLGRRGRVMPIKDSLIAASAREHDVTVATRNTDDYRNAGVRIVNPFEG